MEKKYISRIAAFFYIALVVLCIFVGFQYSNDSDDYYGESFNWFNNGWRVDGSEILFPYGESEAHFTINNTLPIVYSDQYLIVKAYYDSFTVFLDGNEIMHSTENYFMGKTTDAGKKEMWIPLQTDYSGKEISIELTMQKELYGATITEAFITTRSEYAVRVLKANIPSMLVFAAFSVTAIIEIVLADIYSSKFVEKRRRRLFDALFYAGFFSLASAQWIINDCRLPYIVFGHIVGYSIITIIAFLLMPILFLKMQRCLYYRNGSVDYIVDGIITIGCFGGLFLALLGIVNWGDLIYVAQISALTVLMVVGYYSITDIVKRDTANKDMEVSYANITFIMLAVLSLVLYINSILSNYVDVFILDLCLYVFVQVGIIYRRIDKSIKEEQELVKTKAYAFSDELTKLGNRRKFYHLIDELEEQGLPEDFTIIIVDTNRLKYYNDNMGHEAGDEVIVGTAECLQDAFAGFASANICRVGGDEFAISIVATSKQVEACIELFKRNLSNWRGKYVNNLSAAVGYASLRDHTDTSIMGLQSLADEKMYADKKNFYEHTGLERRKN